MFLAAVLLVLLGSGIGMMFFCTAAWCPDVTPSKRGAATDFASCQKLGFPVEETHPSRCLAGSSTFYAVESSRLRVAEPRSEQTIGLPLLVSGSARIGSGTTARLLLSDLDGFGLAEERISLPKALSGQIVPFGVSVSYPRPLGTGGTLSVSLFSRQGQLQDEAVIPVRFSPLASIEIKAYFGNRGRDPQAQYCDESYPVARRITLAEDLLAAALRELLKGPAFSEENEDYFTSLPQGLSVLSLRDDDGRVTVTFNKALSEGVAGSCRVRAIRSQIERTLKQFSFVREVHISIEGVLDEEVLQP